MCKLINLIRPIFFLSLFVSFLMNAYVCMYVGGGMTAVPGSGGSSSGAVGVPGSTPTEDEVRLYNELEVIIHKVVCHTYIRLN